MCIYLGFLICLFNFKSDSFKQKQELIQSRVFTKWINNFLKMKDISIGRLEDLAEIPNFNSFSEVFWGDTINDFFDISMNTKGSKTTNFKSVIDYLELKEIQIPDFNMKPIIQKRKSNDLLKIVWNIISNQTIDNTYFNGIRGKSGL